MGIHAPPFGLNPAQLVYPTTDGSANAVLITDGAKHLSWGAVLTAALAIGLSVGSGTAGAILYVDASNKLAQDPTHFSYDPTAHALSVPAFIATTFGGVAGSGADQVGSDVIVAAGQGTGTGAGGALHLQTAPAGLTGASVNALVDQVVIASDGTATFTAKIVVPELDLGATPFVFKDLGGALAVAGPSSNLLLLDTRPGGLNPQAVFDFNTGSTFGIAFGSSGSPQLVSSGQIDLIGTVLAGNTSITISPSGSDEIDCTLADGTGTYLYDGALQPQADGQLDLGQVTTPRRWRTGYFGTSVVSPLYSVASGAGNSGITTTITTASLVGKTITVQGGIITGFA